MQVTRPEAMDATEVRNELGEELEGVCGVRVHECLPFDFSWIRVV
jgi:hypothetical protein